MELSIVNNYRKRKRTKVMNYPNLFGANLANEERNLALLQDKFDIASKLKDTLFKRYLSMKESVNALKRARTKQKHRVRLYSVDKRILPKKLALVLKQIMDDNNYILSIPRVKAWDNFKIFLKAIENEIRNKKDEDWQSPIFSISIPGEKSQDVPNMKKCIRGMSGF